MCVLHAYPVDAHRGVDVTKVSEPFVKFDCAGCGREIDRQISARRARSDIDELRDGPPLYCAECGPGLPVPPHGSGP
jgi:predicted RNA-binding Zn-ribbon protein involved in translation (DUF1610 family)